MTGRPPARHEPGARQSHGSVAGEARAAMATGDGIHAADQTAATVRRRRRRQALILAACGTAVGIILLLVVAAMNRSPAPTGTARDRPASVDRPTSGSDAPSGVPDETSPGSQRGWIQVTDATGRLAQQYRCSFLEPNPDGRGAGWLRMRDPEIEIHLDDGTLLALRGELALVSAPGRAVESGEISGDVLITVWERADRPGFSRTDEAPSLRVRTGSAEFDNRLGTVRTPGALTVETAQGEFIGDHLSLWLSEGDAAAGTLRVERVSLVRLAARPRADASAVDARTPPGSARDTVDADVPGRRAAPASRGVIDAPDPSITPPSARPARRADRSGPSGDPVWYELVLADEVRVETGAADVRRTAEGDRLSVLFTSLSRGLGAPLSPRTALRGAPAAPARRDPPGPGPMLAQIAASVFATMPQGASPTGAARPPALRPLAPPPADDDIRIRCAGPLRIQPAPAGLRRPAEATDTAIELTGRPVRLRDRAIDASARGARLRLETESGAFLLEGDPDDANVQVIHPEMRIDCRAMSLQPGGARGRLDGPGSLRLHRLSRGERLEISWTGHVDLELDAAPAHGARQHADGTTDRTHADGTGLFLPDRIRAARFNGDTALSVARDGGIDLLGGSTTADEVRMRADHLDAGFGASADGRTQLERLSGRGRIEMDSGARLLFADAFTADLDPDAAESEADGATRDAWSALRTAQATGGVELRLDGGQRVLADALRIDGATRSAWLDGQNIRLIDTQAILDTITRLEVDGPADVQRIIGPGRFWRFAEPVDLPRHGRLEPAVLDRLAGGAEEMRVTWRDGAEIAPFPARHLPDPETDPQRDPAAAHQADPEAGPLVAPPSDGEARRISFVGGVRILSPELEVTGIDRLEARAPVEDGRIRFIDQIGARGLLDVRAIGREGTCRCRALTVDLARGARPGEVIPTRLVAAGSVEAADDAMHLHCGRMTLTFHRIDESMSTSARRPATGRASWTSPGDERDVPRPARAEVETALAEDALVIVLATGERIFADRATVRGGGNEVDVEGEPVTILTPELLLDDVRRLEIRQASAGSGSADAGSSIRRPVTATDDDAQRSRASALGPGTLIGFAPSPSDTAGAIAIMTRDQARAVASALTPRLTASWEGSATIELDPEDHGLVRFREGAVIVTDPDPREQSTVRGDDVAIAFARRARSGGEASPVESGGSGRTVPQEHALDGFELRSLHGRGRTMLESRQWRDGTRADLPRVLSIQGDGLSFDQATLSLDIDGAGELLVRGGDTVDDTASGAFGTHGTTLFRWTRALSIRQVVAEQFTIAMTGRVECLHRDERGGTATLTAERLDAGVARPDRREPAADAPAGAAPRTVGGLDPGGPFDLRRLRGEGGVFVRTQARDVTCDIFDLSMLTGIAELDALPGRPPVSVLPRGAAQPVTARRVLWNMQDDTITIVRPGGGL